MRRLELLLRLASYVCAAILMFLGLVGVIWGDYKPNAYELLSLGALFYIGTEISKGTS